MKCNIHHGMIYYSALSNSKTQETHIRIKISIQLDTCQVVANDHQFLHPRRQFPFQDFEASHQPGI